MAHFLRTFWRHCAICKSWMFSTVGEHENKVIYCFNVSFWGHQYNNITQDSSHEYNITVCIKDYLSFSCGSLALHFRAVLMEFSRSLSFFTRSGVTASCSSTHDTNLEPYCSSLENDVELRPETQCNCLQCIQQLHAGVQCPSCLDSWVQYNSY